MALFKKSEPAPEPVVEPAPPPRGAKKAAPTPTRREAEAARRQRLNPSLSPKEAKAKEREARYEARMRTMAESEATPERQLMRDHVDSRFNPAEFALPLMLVILVVTLVPALRPYYSVLVLAMWGYIALMVLDAFLMWRSFKALAADKLPGRPLRGLLMYGFNRQMTFRRWRRPAPAVKRGEKP